MFATTVARSARLAAAVVSATLLTAVATGLSLPAQAEQRIATTDALR